MSTTQGEHTFDVEVLISGEAMEGFSAGEDINQGEPVVRSGDYEVSTASDGGPAMGVALYDVASGEEVAIAAADGDSEVRLETSETLSANAEITPDGLGTVRQTVEADPDITLGICNDGAAAGEIVEAQLTQQSGDTA